jgi:hypothetical protein
MPALSEMASARRLERLTSGFVDQRSFHLSYADLVILPHGFAST